MECFSFFFVLPCFEGWFFFFLCVFCQCKFLQVICFYFLKFGSVHPFWKIILDKKLFLSIHKIKNIIKKVESENVLTWINNVRAINSYIQHASFVPNRVYMKSYVPVFEDILISFSEKHILQLNSGASVRRQVYGRKNSWDLLGWCSPLKLQLTKCQANCDHKAKKKEERNCVFPFLLLLWAEFPIFLLKDVMSVKCCST